MKGEVKERGMIFNDEMVRAILGGNKTQTRRIVEEKFYGRAVAAELLAKHCPYGQPGDRIWVRETYRVHGKAWNCGRDIDQPVCADSVDAMAVWHVDCQYIPTESLIESDCTAYVAYKKGSWNGNDVYWLQHGGLPTDDFSKATIFSVANKNEPGIVWLPFSIADAAKRRTFNINNFNRRTMVQGAGLVMPDWLKEQNRRKKSRSGKVRWNCPHCGKITWQYSPYDFEGCSDYNCEGWRE